MRLGRGDPLELADPRLQGGPPLGPLSRCPVGRLRQGEGRRADPLRPQTDQFPQDAIQRLATGPQRRVHPLRMPVEPGQAFGERPVHLGSIVGAGPTQLKRAAQFRQHLALVRFVAVQLQAQGAKAHLYQPPLYHLQCGHLLRDEQHPFSVMHGRSDQVGNRLRLARARRSLDHQVAAPADLLDHGGLGAVGIHHVQAALGRQVRVEWFLLGKQPGLRCKTGPQQRHHQRMLGQGTFARPLRRVQIAVHQ